MGGRGELTVQLDRGVNNGVCMYIIYIYYSSWGLVTGLYVLGKNTTLESPRLVHAPF